MKLKNKIRQPNVGRHGTCLTPHDRVIYWNPHKRPANNEKRAQRAPRHLYDRGLPCCRNAPATEFTISGKRCLTEFRCAFTLCT